MAQVKFYRGLDAYYVKEDHKDGIYFSMDKHVIYHDGKTFGGIDPQYFSGVTKDFDIDGQTVSFQKLNDKGVWVPVSIRLVEAGDSSVEIGTITNTEGNVNDGFTVKVKAQYAKDGEDGLKLGADGLYVDLTKKTEAIAANKAAIDTNKANIETLNGADNVDGSVSNKIKVAIEGLDVNAIGGDGKVITTISETNGVIAATAIDLAAENVAATAIEASDETVAVEGTNVKAQISSLAQSIKSVSGAAKSYSISAITDTTEITALGLGANVREAYQLVDEDGTQAGATIKIYKDSSLKEVNLVGQELQFTYILTDGSENTVGVDVSTFLAESEFKNGLEVVNHLVNVKIDSNSETFLTVGENGVKLSGVQEAIDKAAAKATTKVEKAADADKITLMASATAADGHVTYTIGQKDIASAALLGTAADNKDAATAFGKIAKEIADREAAIQTQNNALNAEIAARKAVDGVDANTYAAKDNANYIKGATSLFDADAKLDAAIKEVADTAAKAHTEVKTKAEGHVRVAVAKSNDGSHDVVTVSEDDIASANALTTETAAREAQDNTIEAAVGLAEDGSHVATSGNYTSGANTVVGEIAALDTKLKEVSDNLNTVSATLQWIDCGVF